MRRSFIFVIGAVTVTAMLIILFLSRASGNRDLITELVTSSVVVEAPIEAISQPTPEGPVGFDITIGSIDTEYLLYEIDTAGRTVIAIDEAAGELPPEVLTYREPNSQRGLGAIAGDAATVVFAIEARAFRPDGAPPLRAQVIALDADGLAIDSDWHGSKAQDQIDALAAAVAAEGVTWTEAIASLIDAGRDRELDRPIDNPLGARLIAAIEG